MASGNVMSDSERKFRSQILVRDEKPLRVCLPKAIENGALYIQLIKEHGGVVSKDPQSADVILCPHTSNMSKVNAKVIDVQWLVDCAEMGWLIDWEAYALPRDMRNINEAKKVATKRRRDMEFARDMKEREEEALLEEQQHHGDFDFESDPFASASASASSIPRDFPASFANSAAARHSTHNGVKQEEEEEDEFEEAAEEEEEDDFESGKLMIQKPAKGKVDYTEHELLKMVAYVKKWVVKKGTFRGCMGNQFWQDAAMEKVTSHTWQSMREKYKKSIKDTWETWDAKLKKQKEDEKRRDDLKAKRGGGRQANNTSNTSNSNLPASSSASAAPRGVKRAAPHPPAPIVPDVKVRAPAGPTFSAPQREAQPHRQQQQGHTHVRGQPASSTILGSVMLNDRDAKIAQLQTELEHRQQTINQQLGEKRQKDHTIRQKEAAIRELEQDNTQLAANSRKLTSENQNLTLQCQNLQALQARVKQLESEKRQDVEKQANLRTALLLANGKELDKETPSEFKAVKAGMSWSMKAEGGGKGGDEMLITAVSGDRMIARRLGDALPSKK